MGDRSGWTPPPNLTTHLWTRLNTTCIGESDLQLGSGPVPMSREDRPASSVLARVKCRRPYKRKGSPTDETLPENGPVPVPNLSSTAVAAMNEEQRITACKTGLERIYAMLRSSPHDWRNFISLGRSVIAHIDATTFMEKASRTTEQAWMIAGLQRLALSDAESGGVPDVAAWCSRQWLAIFQRDQTNVAALRGIGQAWLLRAQPTLLRIQRTDSSSSSGGSARSGSGSATARSQSSHTTGSSVERRRQADAAAKEAERKAGTADYVEARGFLQPAAEYLDRAVAAASSQRILSGDLLATTAEAYMSLGNTSSPRVNERLFRRALQLLRAASQIQGYSLSRYLQQYLDDYGKLLD